MCLISLKVSWAFAAIVGLLIGVCKVLIYGQDSLCRGSDHDKCETLFFFFPGTGKDGGGDSGP